MGVIPGGHQYKMGNSLIRRRIMWEESETLWQQKEVGGMSMSRALAFAVHVVFSRPRNSIIVRWVCSFLMSGGISKLLWGSLECLIDENNNSCDQA